MVYIITWSKAERDTNKALAMKFATRKAKELGSSGEVVVTADDGAPPTTLALWRDGIRIQGWRKQL